MRFLVDHMLYKLGSYLRCLGYDAASRPGASAAELVRLADAEQRTLLTRNTHIGEQTRKPQRQCVLRSSDPVEQLHELVAAIGLDPNAHPFTRCVRCNVLLETLPPDSPRLAALPPLVRRAYRRFFTCPSCGTIFWRGAHVTNTCRKLGIPDAADAPVTNG